MSNSLFSCENRRCYENLHASTMDSVKVVVNSSNLVSTMQTVITKAMYNKGEIFRTQNEAQRRYSEFNSKLDRSEKFSSVDDFMFTKYGLTANEKGDYEIAQDLPRIGNTKIYSRWFYQFKLRPMLSGYNGLFRGPNIKAFMYALLSSDGTNNLFIDHILNSYKPSIPSNMSKSPINLMAWFSTLDDKIKQNVIDDFIVYSSHVVPCACKGWIDWEAMTKESKKRAENIWDFYSKFTPFELDQRGYSFNGEPAASIIESYTKDEFIDSASRFSAFAFVTENSQWHDMNTSGMTAEEWDLRFFDRYISMLDDDDPLAILQVNLWW